MRKSFIVHIDSLAVLDDLTDEQSGELFRAIRAYQLGESIDLSPIVKIAFSPFKNQFARDSDKYEKLCEKNRQIAINRHAKSTSGNHTQPTVTNPTDNKSDSKSKSDSKNDKDSRAKPSRFAPPTLTEANGYFNERGIPGIAGRSEAERFIDFYESKGWMVGKNKMKDWKAAIRNWMKRDSRQPSSTTQSPMNQLTDTSWADGMLDKSVISDQ